MDTKNKKKIQRETRLRKRKATEVKTCRWMDLLLTNWKKLDEQIWINYYLLSKILFHFQHYTKANRIYWMGEGGAAAARWLLQVKGIMVSWKQKSGCALFLLSFCRLLYIAHSSSFFMSTFNFGYTVHHLNDADTQCRLKIPCYYLNDISVDRFHTYFDCWNAQ